MKCKVTLSYIAGIILFCVSFAYGKDASVYAIQNKMFHKNHELTFVSGYVADDDFYNVFPLGISYTFNFNDRISWEVARGEYMINREKDLKGELESEFGVAPSEFMEPVYMIHSSLIVRPFYGKDSYLNKRVINHETYFSLGGGITNYEEKFIDEPSETENVISLSIGAGKKVFVNKKLCVNFEIRDLIRFKDDDTENTIFFGVGIGFRFNLLPRKTEDDVTIERIQEYLETQTK